MEAKNDIKKVESEKDGEDSDDLEYKYEKPLLRNLPEVPEPEYDEEKVLISWYDSDLNLVIDENFTAASPLHRRKFCYLQAGARATYGFYSGKICFEVKVLEVCDILLKDAHLITHILRVGWSPQKASLALGNDTKSYGYDNTGRASTNGEIVDYGHKFSTGDVVGAFLDLGDDNITVSFTLNGEDMGVAYEVSQSFIQKEPLFPHVLTKNISYECNFESKSPWYPPKEGYTFVADVSKKKRIPGPKRPNSKADCEVILMCGLPKSGKTTWVTEFCEKYPGMYYSIDTLHLVDRMEANPKGKSVIRRSRMMGRLLSIAMDRRRNYILDQVNAVRSEQIWKLSFFKNFKRRIVVVTVPDEELQSRVRQIDNRPPEKVSWMLQMKGKFMMPTLRCAQIASVTDRIDYVGLPEAEALRLIKNYNLQAWKLGYKPYKNFVISYHRRKEKRKRGVWKRRGMSNPRNEDYSTGWHSPSRTGDWPPPRNRGDEGWHSPTNMMMSSDCPSPRSRDLEQEHWPSSDRNRLGDGSRSPPQNRIDDDWHMDMTRREVSRSPPRKRPGDRRGARAEMRSLPRSRREEWEARRGRLRMDRNSSPRKFFGGPLLPLRGRSGEQRFRSKDQFQDSEGMHVFDERDRPPPGDMVGGDWPPHEEFHHWDDQRGDDLHEVMPMDEDVLRRRSMDDEGFPPSQHQFRDDFPPQEVRVGERFPPGDSRIGGGFPSPPLQHKNDFLPQKRFEGDLPPQNNRIGPDFHGGGMNPDFSLRENRHRISGTFPHQEERPFSPHDMRMGPDFPPEGIGSMLPMERRMHGSSPPRGRAENDFLSFQDRMGGTLPPIEGRHGGNLPHEIRPARSVSPRERMMGDGPHKGRTFEDVPPNMVRFIDIPSHGGRMDENLHPHGSGIGRDMPGPRGRTRENFLTQGNRPSGSPIRGDRIMPPEEHRMHDDYPHVRPGGPLSPRGGRSGDAFSQQQIIRGDPLHLPGDRMVGNMPLHEGRMVGDLQLHEGRFPSNMSQDTRFGNIPSQESKVGALPPHRVRPGDDTPPDGRTIGQPPLHGGRNVGDHPPRSGRTIDDPPPYGGRAIGDPPSHGGRPIDDPPFHGGRTIGDPSHLGGRIGDRNVPPLGERIGDMPHRGRSSADFAPGRRGVGDFPPHGGRIGIGDMPLQGRIVGDDSPSSRMDINVHQEGRIDDDMPHHGGRYGDMSPTRGGRIGGDMLPQGERSGGDISPLIGTTDRDNPPHGRRTGRDMPPRGGRIAGDMQPLGRRIVDVPPLGGRLGGDFSLRGGRGGGDLVPHRGRHGGDLPSHGGKIGDLPPQEVNHPGVHPLSEGRDGSSWNRDAPSTDHPTKFARPMKQGWLGGQDYSGNKGSDGDGTGRKSHWNSPDNDVHGPPFKPDLAGDHGPNFQFQEERGSSKGPPENAGQLRPHGAKGGWKAGGSRAPVGNWQPGDGSSPSGASHSSNLKGAGSQQFPQRPGGRDNEVSPNLAHGGWRPETRQPRSGRPSPGREGEQGRMPERPLSPIGARQRVQQLGGRTGSPARPLGGERSPEDRPRRSRTSSLGRPREGRRSPRGRGEHEPEVGGRGWPLSGGQPGSDWQSSERDVDRGDRMPPNVGFGERSPLWKSPQQNRPFSQGGDLRSNFHGPGFLQQGSVEKQLDVVSRGVHDRMLHGVEMQGRPKVFDAPFDPHRQDSVPPGAQFPGKGFVKNPGGNWQTSGAGPREGWQSPGGSDNNREGHWERRVLIVPEQDTDKLAPYEVPFNQAVWDSNEPTAGVFQSFSDNHPQMNPVNNINQDKNENQHPASSRNCSGSKTQVSVCQRMGGYVDEKEHQSRDYDRSSDRDRDQEREREQNPPGLRQFGEHMPSGSRVEKGHPRDTKERGHDYVERSRRRSREREMPLDKRPRLEPRRSSPPRGDRRLGTDSPRDRWREQDRRPTGRGRW